MEFPKRKQREAEMNYTGTIGSSKVEFTEELQNFAVGVQRTPREIKAEGVRSSDQTPKFKRPPSHHTSSL